ncbi:hypothetical protein PIB30_108532, partial [Stylosanthes scabra]|nr:hypothetical protein [Stylosanthes scabra]
LIRSGALASGCSETPQGFRASHGSSRISFQNPSTQRLSVAKKIPSSKSRSTPRHPSSASKIKPITPRRDAPTPRRAAPKYRHGTLSTGMGQPV